jgi:hypothetical protein
MRVYMRTILISYDLNNTGKDYNDVIAYIKTLGAWARPLRSQWLVKTDQPVLSIIHGLRGHGADNDDSLLVLDVTKVPAAWAGLSPEVAEWIKADL